MKKRAALDLVLRTSRHLSAEELLSVVYQQTVNNPCSVQLQVEKEAMSELAVKIKDSILETPTEPPRKKFSESGYFEVQTFWMLWKLQFLMRGRQMVRADVVNFMTSLLNAQITAPAASSLAPLFYGMGKCWKFAKDDPRDPWEFKEMPIKEAVPNYTEFPGLCRSQYLILCGAEDLAAVALRIIKLQSLLDKSDAVIALVWETCGGWGELLKPTQLEGGSKSPAVQTLSERLQSLTEGSKQVAKRNTNQELNAILAKYVQEQAQLHQAAKKAKKELNTLMIQDLQPFLTDKKLMEGLAEIGPQLQDIELTVSALTYGLKKANYRVKKICELLQFELQLEKATDGDLAYEAEQLDSSLNQLIFGVISSAPAFKKFKEPAELPVEDKKEEEKQEKKQEGKAQKKGGKKQKEMPYGKGTAQFIQYLGKVVKAGLEAGRVQEATDPYTNQAFKQLLNGIMSQHNQERRRPKIPKGARDMDPFQMRIKQIALQKIRSVFESHGAMEIDTPVFELKETLTGKYGQDSKLIYDLEDQGGELLSLRYDLTVPFARYVATKNVMSIKRYHIAKVYRRDNPQMARGRFREFYQCDFDIAGSYSGAMLPDVDVLRVIVDILKSLELGEFVIKLNHRKFLDAIIELSGCDAKNFNSICSSIDKLDKEPWAKIAKELIHTKGIDPESVEKLKQYVELRGSVPELLEKLKNQEVLKDHPSGLKALEEMTTLGKYMEELGLLEHFSLDFSLARGLDYYTGVIFEAVLIGGHVGSIAGGGRYDGLIGQFMGKKQIPSVGGSIGIERVFAILEDKARAQNKARASPSQVLVCSIGKNMTPHRLRLCDQLWRAGFCAEFLYVDNPKPANQLTYALENKIPLMLWIGEDEIAKGIVQVKTTATKEQVEVSEAELMGTVREKYEKVKDLAIAKEE